MTLSTLRRRIRDAETASQGVVPIALLPLVPLWLEAVRRRELGDEAPGPAAAASTAVRAALESIKAQQRRLSDGEAELVAACVRALRVLSLDELRFLAGPRNLSQPLTGQEPD